MKLFSARQDEAFQTWQKQGETRRRQRLHSFLCTSVTRRSTTSQGFLPHLQPRVELPTQPPSCSSTKPDVLPFPSKLLQPDSLANHPRTWMNTV